MNTNPQTIRDFLTLTLTYEHLADFLCADAGNDMVVWDDGGDGAVMIVPKFVNYDRSDDRPFARVPCPGNLRDVVRERCENGYMEVYMDALITALEQNEEDMRRSAP